MEIELGKEIGRGGQCRIYEGKTKNLFGFEDSVAIKKPKNPNRPGSLSRLEREAKILKQLNHKGIPKYIHSFFSDDNKNHSYLSLELIPGCSLTSYLKKNLVSIEEAHTLFIQLILILDYVHQQGINHRDIKPSNIMLRDNDLSKPVLIDFGIAFTSAGDDEELTVAMEELGNRFLVLPELRVGDKRDNRSDLTQACGVLFFLLFGYEPKMLLDRNEKKPHQGLAAKKESRQHPFGFSLYCTFLFNQAFEHDPNWRWQSAQDILQLESLFKITYNQYGFNHDYSEPLANASFEPWVISKQDDPELVFYLINKRMIHALRNCLLGELKLVTGWLGTHFNYDIVREAKDIDSMKYEVSVRYWNELFASEKYDLSFRCQVNGSNMKVFRVRDTDTIDIFELMMPFEDDPSGLRKAIRSYLRQNEFKSLFP